MPQGGGLMGYGHHNRMSSDEATLRLPARDEYVDITHTSSMAYVVFSSYTLANHSEASGSMTKLPTP